MPIAGLVCMVCQTENLLALQYTVYSEIPFSRNSYHGETSYLQCIANQLIGFNRHSKFNPRRAGLFENYMWGREVHWAQSAVASKDLV